MIEYGQYLRVSEALVNLASQEGTLEDSMHSNASAFWLQELTKGTEYVKDYNLIVAAHGSDIERVVSNEKIDSDAYSDYVAYRAASNKKSANIVAEIMVGEGVAQAEIDDIVSLISSSHAPSNERVHLVTDADSLSFLMIRAPFYWSVAGDSLENRCYFEYERMSERAKVLLKQKEIIYSQVRMNQIMSSLIGVNTIKKVNDLLQKAIDSVASRSSSDSSFAATTDNTEVGQPVLAES